jgi:EAL domain-containing protein (putative c-di-GMP-specific phosphodiesterase class I)
MIDRWVVRQAITLLGQWHPDHPDCEPPVCSVNLSAASFGDENLAQDVAEQLAEHKLPADVLCFEITEAAALGNLHGAVRLVARFRALGCRMAVQDFGYGVASFPHLKALSVDFLKIPGQVTRAVAHDELHSTLVSAVGRVGEIMGIATIATQVEAEAALDRLRALGIAYAQGFALARPAPLVTPDGSVGIPCIQRSA